MQDSPTWLYFFWLRYSMGDGSQVRPGYGWNTALYKDVSFVSFGQDPVFTYPLPDPVDTVLRIQLKKGRDGGE